MQSLKKILEHAAPAQTCSVLPVMKIEKNQEQTMSSPSSDSAREHKRIDLLFSKFAAFYGHIWRSQFKDEAFLKFAKKEWHEGLSVFSDAVLSEAIVGCRDQYEMPPTLPQMIYYCKQIRKRKEFRIREEDTRAQESVVALNVKRCLELLA
jgi:hypothetical protein